jgi:hypothetical protein
VETLVAVELVLDVVTLEPVVVLAVGQLASSLVL